MSEPNRVQRWRQRQRAAGKKPLTIWVTDEEKLRLKHMLAQWQGESFPVTDTVTDTIFQGVTDTVTAMRTFPLSHAGNIDATATVTDTQSIVTFTVTDTEEAIEVAGVTDTVTDTSPVLSADYTREIVPERVTDTVTDTHGLPVAERAMDHQGEYVTDTVTDTSAQTEAERVAIRALQAVTDTITDTSTEPVLAVTDTITDTGTVTDTVTVTEAQHRGRKPVLRPGILALLDEHPDGLTAAELKVYLGTEKHIGDTLAGMVKAQLVVKLGTGQGLRYQLTTAEAKRQKVSA